MTDHEVNVSDTAGHRARGVHRAEYARRMNRVLDYIDLHLDQPLDLARLAGVANFSPFHFHRVFAAWMGETLGDYARRRRLEKPHSGSAAGRTNRCWRPRWPPA